MESGSLRDFIFTLCLRKWAQRDEVLCQHLAQVSLNPGSNADVPIVPQAHLLVIRLLFQHSELPAFLSWPFKGFCVLSKRPMECIASSLNGCYFMGK